MSDLMTRSTAYASRALVDACIAIKLVCAMAAQDDDSYGKGNSE